MSIARGNIITLDRHSVFEDCVFESNIGLVHVQAPRQSEVSLLRRCLFLGSQLEVYGGVLRMEQCHFPTQHSLVEGNPLVGVYNGNLKMLNCTVERINPDLEGAPQSLSSSAIVVSGSQARLTIEGGKYEDNYAEYGGVISCEDNGLVEVRDVIIENNHAKYGGFLYSQGCALDLLDVVVWLAFLFPVAKRCLRELDAKLHD